MVTKLLKILIVVGRVSLYPSYKSLYHKLCFTETINETEVPASNRNPKEFDSTLGGPPTNHDDESSGSSVHSEPIDAEDENKNPNYPIESRKKHKLKLFIELGVSVGYPCIICRNEPPLYCEVRDSDITTLSNGQD